jgi:DNA mismatch repair protein MutS
MGDFYETFFEDAKTCSKALGLTLTSRDKGSDNPIPLAGVPYHAVDGYLRKMLQAGYKVAVCEQIEDPKTAKGLVKRDVVRVVTPGTLTDDVLLDAKQDNFLVAVWQTNATSAISWVDVSTGHFFVQQMPEQEILDEIVRLSPAECLLPDRRGELFEAQSKKLAKGISELTGAAITQRPSWYFDPYQARQRLLKHFGTATLEGFGIHDSDGAIIPPAGAILEYLNETQRTAIAHISGIKKVSPKKSLHIDHTSLRGLEVLQTIRTDSKKGTLLDCLDQTLTPMGGRMFRNWLCRPLCELESIELRQEIRRLLGDIADPERIAARIATARAAPRDLVALARTLRQVPNLREMLAKFNAKLLANLAGQCDSMDELADLLEAAIEPDCPMRLSDGSVIRTGFNKELDELRSISRDGQSWLQQYQKQQIERTGIDRLKVGFNQVFGYYIEVSRSNADKVPADYIRKQTIKNAER